MALYDRIGLDYAALRRPDPRIQARLHEALGLGREGGAARGGARSVLNVGAGAGSYEPRGRRVVAVERARTMIRQRSMDAAPAVQADSVRLPFADGCFDAAMAVLTVHHWSDRAAGLREMRRVSRGPVVVLSWDPAAPAYWLSEDYFPDMVAVDRRIFPALDEFEAALGPCRITPLPIPHDCSDGFLGAYWRRPEAYLDARVRGAISTFQRLEGLEPRLRQLERDLTDGSWQRRHGELMAQPELDLGYRLVISPGGT